MQKYRKYLFLRFISKFWPRGGSHSCANRHERSFVLGKLEVTLTLRDTSKPDGYSREELYGMLKIIRQAEAETNWLVPEPPKAHAI